MTEYVRNIINSYERASVEDVNCGNTWYAEAKRWCVEVALKLDVPVSTVVGVVAVLSPQCRWSRNKELAIELFITGTASFATKQRLDKALRLLNGTAAPYDVLTTEKVRNFYNNIMSAGSCDCVTVDTHAIAIAFGRKPTAKEAKAIFDSPNKYDVIAEAYRTAAKAMNVSPPVMQAVTWCVQRGAGY